MNLQVLQEVSNATAETQFGAPVISTREASTQMFLKDGQTAVIGGLIEQQQERSKSGIPVLMNIPLIGGLFGSVRNTTVSGELFLFLTPHVVADDAGAAVMERRVEQGTPLIHKELNPPPSVFGPDSTATTGAAPPVQSR